MRSESFFLAQLKMIRVNVPTLVRFAEKNVLSVVMRPIFAILSQAARAASFLVQRARTDVSPILCCRLPSTKLRHSTG